MRQGSKDLPLILKIIMAMQMLICFCSVQVLGLLQANQVPTKVPYAEVTALYPMASLVSHSCMPNTRPLWKVSTAANNNNTGSNSNSSCALLSKLQIN